MVLEVLHLKSMHWLGDWTMDAGAMLKLKKHDYQPLRLLERASGRPLAHQELKQIRFVVASATADTKATRF